MYEQCSVTGSYFVLTSGQPHKVTSGHMYSHPEPHMYSHPEPHMYSHPEPHMYSHPEPHMYSHPEPHMYRHSAAPGRNAGNRKLAQSSTHDTVNSKQSQDTNLHTVFTSVFTFTIINNNRGHFWHPVSDEIQDYFIISSEKRKRGYRH